MCKSFITNSTTQNGINVSELPLISNKFGSDLKIYITSKYRYENAKIAILVKRFHDV